jgi:general secretion pathway protein A
MYLEYWGLADRPFRNTTDPRYLCPSEQHVEALTRLQYAVHSNLACTMLTGIFGSGKTLVAQALLENLKADRFAKAFIFNPKLTDVELLKEIVYQLGYHEKMSDEKTEVLHRLTDILNDNYSESRHTVIVVDEAHLIEERSIFEELRLLLNFQKKDKFLLTLILVGQPELREKIAQLKPFDQRVSMRFHLKGLRLDETKIYIDHRLKVAGTERQIFAEETYRLIHESTGGLPRRINQVCDLALLTGYGQKADKITVGILNEVLMDPQTI